MALYQYGIATIKHLRPAAPTINTKLQKGKLVYKLKNPKSCAIGRSVLVLLVLVVLCVAFCALSGCETDPDPCPKKEVIRKTSPDGRLAAILQARDCGKFTTIDYQVLINETGQKGPGHGFFVFQADYLEGAELTWLSSRLLEISYQKARIFRFTNIWRAESKTGKTYVVEVRLKQLSDGAALTPQARGEAGQGKKR